MRRAERRKYRRRILWGRVILAAFIVSFAIWGGYNLVGYLIKHKFFLGSEEVSKGVTVERPPEEKRTETLKPEIAKRVVYVYLPDSQYAKLIEERREIPESSVEDAIRELLKILSEGKNRVIPQGTELKRVFIGKGIVFLDFSSDIVKNHPGGSNAELVTIYSIVNSICKSFPEFKMVQFLIEGKVADTLKGHIDISLPIEPIWKFGTVRE